MLIQPPTRSSLAQALRRVATDAELRRELHERSLACAKNFRWERTARQTMEILARAAGLQEGI